MGMCRFAREYVAAGHAVLREDQFGFSSPLYFLFGHAIELALKAFLLARGTPYNTLRFKPYAHDLSALLKEARRRRLGSLCKLSKQDVGLIHLLNAQYATKRFEYIVTGSYTVPAPDVLFVVAAKLVKSLEAYCYSVTYPDKPNNSFKPTPLRGAA